MLGAAIAPVAEASASVASVASSDAASVASVASVLASVLASVVASSFPPHATSDNPIAIANESANAFLIFLTKKPSF